jgi:hypothetical protein
VTDSRIPQQRRAVTAAAAHHSDTLALLTGTYSLFALVAAMVQAGKLTHLNLEAPSSTVSWFVWWSLSAVFAVIVAAAATVVSTLLRVEPSGEPTTSEQVDDVSGGTE